MLTPCAIAVWFLATLNEKDPGQGHQSHRVAKGDFRRILRHCDDTSSEKVAKMTYKQLFTSVSSDFHAGAPKLSGAFYNTNRRYSRVRVYSNAPVWSPVRIAKIQTEEVQIGDSL